MFVYQVENQLAQCLENISKIEVFENGKKCALEGVNIEKTISKLKDLFLCSRLMPAFSVSLHNETLDALSQGQWLKLSFSHQQSVSALFFDALVFELNETAGMNLIREYEGKYEGRCLYLDFDETVNLEDIIK